MADIKDYNPTFTKIYHFMGKYLNAQTDDEWMAMTLDMGQFTTEFEIGVSHKVMDEVKRLNEERCEP